MWNLVSFTTDANGAGNGNILISTAEILGAIVIPVQDGINSGTTKLVVSHLLPTNLPVPPPPVTIFTATTVTTPFYEVPKKLGTSPTNVADTILGFQLVGSLNLSITNGVANKPVNILVLLTDNNLGTH